MHNEHGRLISDYDCRGDEGQTPAANYRETQEALQHCSMGEFHKNHRDNNNKKTQYADQKEIVLIKSDKVLINNVLIK